MASKSAVCKQSGGKIKVKVLREVLTRGRVVVPWSITCPDATSPYKDLHGLETFKDGEGESHIEIELQDEPRATSSDGFMFVLFALFYIITHSYYYLTFYISI